MRVVCDDDGIPHRLVLDGREYHVSANRLQMLPEAAVGLVRRLAEVEYERDQARDLAAAQAEETAVLHRQLERAAAALDAMEHAFPVLAVEVRKARRAVWPRGTEVA